MAGIVTEKQNQEDAGNQDKSRPGVDMVMDGGTEMDGAEPNCISFVHSGLMEVFIKDVCHN